MRFEEEIWDGCLITSSLEKKKLDVVGVVFLLQQVVGSASLLDSFVKIPFYKMCSCQSNSYFPSFCK